MRARRTEWQRCSDASRSRLPTEGVLRRAVAGVSWQVAAASTHLSHVTVMVQCGSPFPRPHGEVRHISATRVVGFGTRVRVSVFFRTHRRPQEYSLVSRRCRRMVIVKTYLSMRGTWIWGLGWKIMHRVPESDQGRGWRLLEQGDPLDHGGQRPGSDLNELSDIVIDFVHDQARRGLVIVLPEIEAEEAIPGCSCCVERNEWAERKQANAHAGPGTGRGCSRLEAIDARESQAGRTSVCPHCRRR